MKCNLIVVRSGQMEGLKTQYEMLGLQFIYHRHGNGAFHYSAEIDGFVFEIYPLPKSKEVADDMIRLGFSIRDLKTKIPELQKADWVVCSEWKHTEWGWRMVVRDLDGRKVELVEEVDL